MRLTRVDSAASDRVLVAAGTLARMSHLHRGNTYHWTPPTMERPEQPVPMGTLRPETSMPRTALTSDETHGSLEFSTFWQHWGVPVVEPEPPSVGAAAARVAKPARARVKTLANMMIVRVLRREGEV
jgi:hypothetical protein